MKFRKKSRNSTGGGSRQLLATLQNGKPDFDVVFCIFSTTTIRWLLKWWTLTSNSQGHKLLELFLRLLWLFIRCAKPTNNDWRGKANEMLKKRYQKSKRSLFKVVFCLQCFYCNKSTLVYFLCWTRRKGEFFYYFFSLDEFQICDISLFSSVA